MDTLSIIASALTIATPIALGLQELRDIRHAKADILLLANEVTELIVLLRELDRILQQRRQHGVAHPDAALLLALEGAKTKLEDLSKQAYEIDRKVTIGTLDLDVRTPTDLPPGTQIAPIGLRQKPRYQINRSDRRGPYYCCDQEGNDVGEPLDESLRYVHPASLVDFLAKYLGDLLDMTYHTSSYGAMVYERVGRIRFLVDGPARLGPGPDAGRVPGRGADGHPFPRRADPPHAVARESMDIVRARGAACASSSTH